jgi:DNA repair protein RecO (recombination protein O)
MATRIGRAARPAAPQSAYVLHRFAWSESSLILDVFTREQGRLAVAAKGVRRPYSQLRSVLLPFQRVQLLLGRSAASDGGGEVLTLRSAEWAGGAAMLTGAALFSGFYLNELLMKLLARQDPHELLFDAYAHTLATLATVDEAAAGAALRAFELVLLQQIGLLPDLANLTLTPQVVEPSRKYTLVPEGGVCAVRAGLPEVSGSVLLALQAALDQGRLDALQAACSVAAPALKTLLRGLLHYHLGSSPLHTRKVMLELQALSLPFPQEPR